MSDFQTDQEKFWAGEFGDLYANRNRGEEFLGSQINYFSKIFESMQPIKSVMEFGANIGENLKAIQLLSPKAKLSAVEINIQAVKELKKWAKNSVKVYAQSILDFKPDHKSDFVFTKGVLIHMNPEKLDKVYQLLYNTSSKYICIGEYYSPTPTQVTYRGNSDRLFKRDFAGEIMKKYKNLRLIDYGFSYHKDNNFPQDDITWFLFEK